MSLAEEAERRRVEDELERRSEIGKVKRSSREVRAFEGKVEKEEGDWVKTSLKTR
jgi:hypothetical protein